MKPISYLFKTHSGGVRAFAPAVFVAGLILLIAVGKPWATSPQEDTPLPPDPRFGAVETYHAPEIADEIGVGWTRIIFYWSEIEREGPDDWNWFHAPLDRIDREIAGGREVVGMVVHTPAWATDGLPGAGVPRGLYLPLDDPDNVWAAFIRDLVTAYRGRITHWIIWNEPDIALDVYGAQWQGTTEDYYQLVRVAYLVANEIDPDVQIHLGALTYWHNPEYLREFLTVASADPTAAANGYYFDAVSAHIYFKPETTGEIIGSLRAALADFGLDRPIWITETNAPPYDDPTHPWNEPLFPVTMDMQASYLIQQFALALVEGVDRIEVYKWIDQPPPPPGYDVYGLLRPDGDPRPAFFAFEVIVQHLSGTTGGLQVELPEMQEVILSRGDLTTRVLWARTSDTVIAVIPSLATSALRVEQSGEEHQIVPVLGYYVLVLDAATCPEGYGCFIGGPPVLIVEEAQTSLATHSRAAQSFSVTVCTLVRGGGVVLVAVAATVRFLLRRHRKRLRRQDMISTE